MLRWNDQDLGLAAFVLGGNGLGGTSQDAVFADLRPCGEYADCHEATLAAGRLGLGQGVGVRRSQLEVTREIDITVVADEGLGHPAHGRIGEDDGNGNTGAATGVRGRRGECHGLVRSDGEITCDDPGPRPT